MRRAIGEAPVHHLGGLLDDFPHHCCKPGSQLLARYLVTVARVPLVQFVSARRHGAPYCEAGWQAHVWLEAGGLIIDITADQYDEMSPAVVVAPSSEWHDTFQVQSRIPYGEMMRMERPYSRRFERTFKKLVRAMEAPRPRSRKRRAVGVASALNAAGWQLRNAASGIPASAAAFGAAMLRGLGVDAFSGE